MKDTLNPTIAAFIDANNAHAEDAMIACFTPDAVVVDEGQTHRGTEQISEWIARTQAAYNTALEVLGVDKREGETLVTFKVSGTFPGSPVELRFSFTMEGEGIVALTIPG